MPQITLYTTLICPYCYRAKRLLKRKGVVFQEIAVDRDPAQFDIMVTRSRRYTVPQIFIDDRAIGGYDDLAQLDARGELDALLELAR